ncbi:MAG: TlyA family RNA methyltransferase [Actinomycetia bacterium]|nr:TlyA family RNA methyltransferase [Actinomycetes bacterium]
MNRRRLDLELVRRELSPSRLAARACIEAGRVTVGGAPALKATRLVRAEEAIEIQTIERDFASRGGHKLDAALDHFDIDVTDKRVLDAGASTGGFTDCALQRGAAFVAAVDVGYGQISLHLRDDPRVLVIERTNVRHLEPATIGPLVDLVVADLSFISLVTVLEALVGACAPGADLVLLVKPQFEADRAEASRGGGVIRNQDVWRSVLQRVAGEYGQRGAIMGVMLSPVRGPKGNREFFLHLTLAERQAPAIDLDASIDAAVALACVEEGMTP